MLTVLTTVAMVQLGGTSWSQTTQRSIRCTTCDRRREDNEFYTHLLRRIGVDAK
jgi:hypothetical protein